MLYEHMLYDERLKKLADENEDIVVADGKPQKLQVGAEITGKKITAIYTVAVVS